MTIEEITTRKEDQTFDCKSILIDPKALAIPIVAFSNVDGGVIAIDRIVFESPGKLPRMVKPSNIRNTHFSRNPKIAQYLKACHYVKEFGEGVDRIYRELEANGASIPSFRTDDFILKISVPRLTEKLIEKGEKLIEKLTERASANGDRLTENRKAILKLMMEDPYISKVDLAKLVGISLTAVSNNIEMMRGKYLRRVGPDKGGFWEVIQSE